MTLTRKWSLLAVVIILGILAAGWFLMVAPKRSHAAELKQRTLTQEQENARLQEKISMLQSQEKDLPKERARLAVIGRQVPNNPALPALIRNLSSAANQVGVTITSMAPALPTPVVEAAAPVAPVAPATTSTTGGTSGSDATATPAAAPVAPAPSLYQVPLTLGVTGSYFELEQFISRLEGLKRSFLVTGFTVGQATSGGTSTGTEETTSAKGDLTLNLQGRVFLTPPAAPAAPTTPVAAATSGQ
jgi:Tfp pilus assembly protein PilO